MRKSALLKAKAVGVHRAKTHKEDVLSICGPRRQSGMPSIYAPVLFTVGFLELLFLLHTHPKTSFLDYFEKKRIYSSLQMIWNDSKWIRFDHENLKNRKKEVVAKLKRLSITLLLPKLSKQQISCSQMWFIDQLCVKLGSMPLT